MMQKILSNFPYTLLLKKIALIICFNLAIYNGNAQNNDVLTIKSRLKEFIVHNRKDIKDSDKTIETFLNTYNEQGYFNDINYKDKTSSKWQPGNHWRRLAQMAYAYQNNESIYYNKALINQQILTSIHYWLKIKPECPNHWWNVIGVPLSVAEVLVLMENQLSEAEKDSCISLLMKGVKPDMYEYYGKATGQNLLWLANIHIHAACFANDTAGLSRAFREIGNEIVITEGEGIQTDYSFYQHGPLLYSLGYGKGFTLFSAQSLYLAHKTKYELPKEKINIIAQYLLEGQQWLTKNDFMDYSAAGRETARGALDKKGLCQAIKLLQQLDTSRFKAYQAFYDQLTTNKRTKPLEGNKYFYRSDLMVHQRNGYYFSIKGCSNRILGSESANGENIKGFYQGQGTAYMITNHDSYDSIFPLLNWRQLPNLLAEQSTNILPLFNLGKGTEGSTSFVRGISDGQYGCFGYDYQKDKVQAKRSWFFFDDEIVHLVANIHYKSEFPLYQSLNQCLFNNSVLINNKAFNAPFNNSNKTQGVHKYFHDNIGYLVHPSPFTINAQVEERKNTWKSINVTSSADTVKATVFSLQMDLGKEVKDGSLSYTILPNISPKAFDKYNAKDNYTILANNKAIQAVFHKKRNQLQVVVYSSSTITLPWGNMLLKVNKPCLLIIKEVKETLNIQVNSPIDNEANLKYNTITKAIVNNSIVEVN